MSTAKIILSAAIGSTLLIGASIGTYSYLKGGLTNSNQFTSKPETTVTGASQL
ncbi:MAG: hypothetical protein AAF757_22875 [Cyanobacteria bacterium P01_D01_bin.116]